jgi:hypothetical protein
MAGSKLHHYLPRFYQLGFARKGLVAVYDEHKNAFRLGPPRTVGAEKHFYSVTTDAGSPDPFLEDELLTFIDGRASVAFRAVHSGEELTSRHRYDLAVFLGFMFCRTPTYRRLVDQIATDLLRITVRKNIEQAQPGSPLLEPGISDYVNSPSFAWAMSQNHSLATMEKRAREVGKVIFMKHWLFIHSRSDPFVTNDNPFAVVHPQPMPTDFGLEQWGALSDEVVTSFPLSARTCLLIGATRDQLDPFFADKTTIRRINRATIEETERFALAPDLPILTALVRRVGLGPGRAKPQYTSIELPHPSNDIRKSLHARGIQRPPRKARRFF